MKKSILLIVMTILVMVGCKPEERREKEGRTILLYMAADNNLRPQAVMNLQDLELGYIPAYEDKDILLVFLDAGDATSKLIRYYKDSEGGVIKEIIEAYPDRNSATPEVLGEVTHRVVSLFPSDSYGLILWSHGTGWVPSGYYANAFRMMPYFEDPYAHLVKSFGADYDGDQEIEIDAMKDVLPLKYKFIIFDCCLMGGIETTYELRDRADYIIAAPTETLAAGLPYSKIFSYLFKADPDLIGVCNEYFDIYNSQSGFMQSATISLYKTSDLPRLAEVTREIIAANREKIAAVDLADMQNYFRYNDRWYYDFGYFIRTVATEEQYQRFSEIYKSVVTYARFTPSFLNSIVFDPDKTTGMSTYIQPADSDVELDFYYKSLDWNNEVQLVK